MSLTLHSRFLTPAVPLCGNYCNNARDDSMQCISDSAFEDFNAAGQAYMSSATDFFWRKNYSDTRIMAAKGYQEQSFVTNYWADLENQYPFQKQWNKKIFPNIIGGKCEYDSRNSKIWRPFSPTPSQSIETQNIEQSTPTDRRKIIRNSYNMHHTIIPSRVKIEPSKSSVFKPFKKKSFSCSHCSMTYLTSAQLMSHMRVHTGSKPYRCEFSNCFKTFSRNEELSRHRRIHSGYKPHLCTVCGKTFGRKDHLGKHLKTHLQVSEKKIYICCVPGCGHRYTRSDALTRHKSTAHSIQKAKPRIGNKKKNNHEHSEQPNRNHEN